MASSLPNLDYIAGFIDGEGCISVKRAKNRRVGTVFLQITNTNLGILTAIKFVLESFGILSARIFTQNQGGNRKTCYHLDVHKQDDLLLLCTILLDKLYLKRRQCEIVLEYIKLRKTEGKSNHFADERELLEFELHALNKRGLT